MKQPNVYDVIGIGIGPFNLGFAALAHDLPLTTLFLDQRPYFNWHPGLMIEHTTLQVPFLADLVSVADICSRFSFLHYLQKNNKLFRFCIKETFYITRKEYNDYCKWVVAQLPECLFSHRVESITYNKINGYYEMRVHDMIGQYIKTYFTRKIVVGTGASPKIPDCAVETSRERVFHSAEYLYRKKYITPNSTISVIGSGQSAAEIFYDLLQEMDEKQFKLNWFTSSERFYPMENSKLTFEYTSPDYLSYFYKLPQQKKDSVLARQYMLYKGINQELIDAIYDALHHKIIQNGVSPAATIQANSKLCSIDGNRKNGFNLGLHHTELEQAFNCPTDFLILATGYQYTMPSFLVGIKDRIRWTPDGRADVGENYAIDSQGDELFVLNTSVHSHGFLSPDLGMGPYRNASIINYILGKEHFRLDKKIAFQEFGIPVVA